MLKLLLVCFWLLRPMVSETLAINDEKAQIVINYFDDNAQKVPVSGSSWILVKVARIVTETDDKIDGLKIISLVDGLKIDKYSEIEEILQHLELTKQDESHQKVMNIKGLEVYEKITNDQGQIIFDDLEPGVYLGLEQSAAAYHLCAEPFLLSVPATKDGVESDMDQTVEPKAVLGGNLRISKKASGNAVDRQERFAMMIEIPSGTYRYCFADGQTGYISAHQQLLVNVDNDVVIYDVLANQEYKVYEVKANQDGYKTIYQQNEGMIMAKQEVSATIINERSYHDEVDTKVASMIDLALGLWVLSIIVILGLGFLDKSKEHKR